MSEIIKKDDLAGQLAAQELGPGQGHFLPTSGVLKKGTLSAAAQADLIVREARAEGAKILRDAKALLAQMEAKVAAERERGYEQGHQAGLARATELVAAAEAHREKTLSQAEPELINMVFQIVTKILGGAVEHGGVVSVVRQALQGAIGERVTIRVHPEDLEQVRKAEPELVKSLQGGRAIVTLADEAIERGGCAVDTEVGTIDAQLSTQLAAIKKSLGLTEEK